MRVLVIAPEIEGLPKLAQVDELTRLGDVLSIDIDPLVGKLATIDRVQIKLRNNSYDVVIWSGHGADGKILLPSGKTVEPRWLASEVHRSGAYLVVLSVCDSAKRNGYEGFSDVLPAAGISLIGMSSDVSDTAAIDYNVALLHALANGNTIREAHRIGKEAVVGSDREKPQLFMTDGKAAADLGSQVRRLQDAVMSGHSEEAVAIIRQCKTLLSEIEKDIDGLDGRVKRIEKQLYPPWQVRVWQAAAATVILIAMSLLFVYQARDLLFSPWYVGVSFEIILLALAVMFWRMAGITLERTR